MPGKVGGLPTRRRMWDTNAASDTSTPYAPPHYAADICNRTLWWLGCCVRREPRKKTGASIVDMVLYAAKFSGARAAFLAG